MAKEKDHITQSEGYRRYLENQMTPRERHAFEKRMLDDDFEGEAMDGLSGFKSEDIQSDLNDLRSALHNRTKSGFTYWRAAAAILLLGVFSFIIYFVINTNSKTDSLQTRDLKLEGPQEAAEEPKAIIQDTIKQEEPPVIAYNKKLEEEIEEKPAITPSKSQIAEVEVLEDVIELDLAMADEDMVLEEIVLEEMEPAELPAPETEQKPESPDIPVKNSISGRVAGVAIRDRQKSSKELEMPYPTKTISGKVYSIEDSEALPGVNVVVKGSTAGTVTDVEGNYSIDVPADEDVTLVYSYIGFSSAEIEVSNNEKIDVNIEPDVSSLSEIVVVGYGTEDIEEPEYSYIPPRPEGGRNSFREFVKENMRYPASGLEEKIKGTVKLKFTVKTTGTIINMEVVKSLGDDFDKEAIRLVNEGPKWEPAERDGNIVEREVKVKIRFRVPEN